MNLMVKKGESLSITNEELQAFDSVHVEEGGTLEIKYWRRDKVVIGLKPFVNDGLVNMVCMDSDSSGGFMSGSGGCNETEVRGSER